MLVYYWIFETESYLVPYSTAHVLQHVPHPHRRYLRDGILR